MDLAEARRQNAIELMKENALDETGLALCLGKEEEQIEALLVKGTNRKISDVLARQMEQTFSKPSMWLDKGASGQSVEGGPSFDLFG